MMLPNESCSPHAVWPLHSCITTTITWNRRDLETAMFSRIEQAFAPKASDPPREPRAAPMCRHDMLSIPDMFMANTNVQPSKQVLLDVATLLRQIGNVTLGHFPAGWRPLPRSAIPTALY